MTGPRMEPDVTALATLGLLGQWHRENVAAERRIDEHRAALAPTVARLTPTALQALTELVGEEWTRRYGTVDATITFRHRDALRREVRP